MRLFVPDVVEFQGEAEFREPPTRSMSLADRSAYQNVCGQLTLERTLPDGTTDVKDAAARLLRLGSSGCLGKPTPGIVSAVEPAST